MNRQRLAGFLGLSGVILGFGALLVATAYNPILIAALNAGTWHPPFFFAWLPGMAALGFFLILAALAVFYSD